MSLSLVVGLGLGIVVSRPRLQKVGRAIVGVTGVAQAIPSVAVIALMFVYTGIGPRTAVIALSIYGVVPILFNVSSALLLVPADMLEAAGGMGMTPLQVLMRVELPLASQSIMAGLRTTVTIDVSTATVASVIGAGGLGDIIFVGLSVVRPDMIMAGTLLVASIAILSDVLLAFFRSPWSRADCRSNPRRFRMRRVSCVMLVLLLVATMALAGCAKPATKSITMASKDFTEGYVLTSLVVGMLRNAGFTVDEKAGMKTLIIRTALTSKQIDAYVEFTGTAWTTHLKKTDIIRDPVGLFDAVKQADLAANGIDWVSRIDFNDTYALAVRKADAAKFGSNISSLAAYVAQNPKGALFAVNPEFYERPDGFPALTKFYEMSVPSNAGQAHGCRYHLPGSGQPAGRRGDGLFH